MPGFRDGPRSGMLARIAKGERPWTVPVTARSDMRRRGARSTPTSPRSAAPLGPEARRRSARRRAAGHHRVEPPEATLARLLPRLADFGITRVARITGFDRAGVEVFTVVRPNARALSVANGKGLTRTAAKVSGIMEAIERWHGERPLLPLRFGDAGRRRRCSAPRPCLDLPRPVARAGAAAPSPLVWAPALDLATGAAALVPFDAVDTCWLAPPPDVGLLRLDERPRLGLAPGRGGAARPLRARSSTTRPRSSRACRPRPAPPAASTPPPSPTRRRPALLDRLAGAGFAVALWDDDERRRRPGLRLRPHRHAQTRARPPGFGAGCHPDAGTAAAPRRSPRPPRPGSIAMTGTRDDLAPRSSPPTSASASAGRCATTAGPGTPAVARPPPPPTTCAPTSPPRVAAVTRAGAGPVLAVDLSREPGLAVDPHPRPRPRGRQRRPTASSPAAGAARAAEHMR